MSAELEQQLADLQQRIENIEARNRLVDANKRWETSRPRRLLIVAITYVLMVATFFSLGVRSPFTQALVPTLGYLLSTLSLQIARKLWERNGRTDSGH